MQVADSISLSIVVLNSVDHRDEPILLFFSPIFLSGNSFIFNLFF